MEIKLDALKDASKKVLYAGVGAVASLAEVTGDAIEKLSEKGEKVAKESKVIKSGKQAVKEMKENLSSSQSARHFKHTLDNISDMTKEERDALRQKLDEFENSCHEEKACECSEECGTETEECSCDAAEDLKEETDSVSENSTDNHCDTKEGARKDG